MEVNQYRGTDCVPLQKFRSYCICFPLPLTLSCHKVRYTYSRGLNTSPLLKNIFFSFRKVTFQHTIFSVLVICIIQTSEKVLMPLLRTALSSTLFQPKEGADGIWKTSAHFVSVKNRVVTVHAGMNRIRVPDSHRVEQLTSFICVNVSMTWSHH